MELDDKIYDQITKLCDVGDNLADESDYDDAIFILRLYVRR